MGFFNSFFGSKKADDDIAEDALRWIPLTTTEQLGEIERRSGEKLQLIFKHSTSCGISNMVLRQFERSYALEPEVADIYYLDLHSFRAVSNEVAMKFGVHHQSPQLILIRNKEAIGHSSHGAISEVVLENYL